MKSFKAWDACAAINMKMEMTTMSVQVLQGGAWHVAGTPGKDGPVQGKGITFSCGTSQQYQATCMKGQPACQGRKLPPGLAPKPGEKEKEKEKERKYQVFQMGEMSQVASPFFVTAGVVLAVALLGIGFKRMLSSRAPDAGYDQASDEEDPMSSAAVLE